MEDINYAIIEKYEFILENPVKIGNVVNGHSKESLIVRTLYERVDGKDVPVFLIQKKKEFKLNE